MSTTCDICKRKPRASIKRCYSMKANKHRQFLNLQTKTINGKRVKICSRCIRTLAKKASK